MPWHDVLALASGFLLSFFSPADGRVPVAGTGPAANWLPTRII